MTKEEIMNTYAIEQGYESWHDLLKCTVTIHELSQDLNKVTDLIQEELKKKIADNAKVKIRCEYSANSIEDTYYLDKGESNVIEVSRWSILNTEIL